MAKQEKQSITLSGPVYNWRAFGQSRRFASVVLPYAQARQFVQPVIFDGLKGKGEQRQLVPAQVKKLKKEIKQGTYTPATFAANCRSGKHQKAVVFNENDGTFQLMVSESDPLAQTNGNHRYEAIDQIRRETEDDLKAATKAKDEAKIAECKKQIEEIDGLPIQFTIFLDGNPQQDFINLQAGKAIDSSHMLSLKLLRSDEPEMKKAFDIARELTKAEGGPFKEHIRFDSKGAAGIPISTLCSKGASDIATSLVATARIALTNGEYDNQQIAGLLTLVFKTLDESCPDVLEYGKVMTPVKNSGTKGSATMLLGVFNCFLFRQIVGKGKKEDDLKRLVKCVREQLDEKTGGNMAGPRKRELMGGFAKVYLGDMTTAADGTEIKLHHDIPVDLLKLLSCSTFSVEALPKEAKQTKPAATQAKPEEKPAEQPAQTEKPAEGNSKPAGKGDKKTGKGSGKSTPATTTPVEAEKPAEPKPEVKVEPQVEKTPELVGAGATAGEKAPWEIEG